MPSEPAHSVTPASRSSAADGTGRDGVATVAMSDDDAGYELLAVLYEPMGTR